MTLIKKLVSVACWALLSLSYSVSNAQTAGVLDPTQVYTTGNIVQPTVQGTGTTPWVNGVYQDSLTCWAWGDPGYCGPNAIVRPGGNINFSFGMTNLYQMQAIAGVLPNSGSGLRVNGYNFGFTAKNGNGWDGGAQDYLSAYVNFYDPKGSTVYNKNYDLNYRFDWTQFNFSENFTTPYATKDLGSVQYGFVGMDTNYWAGPYGPEIYNVSFNLKYSVDPCAVNVLSSPSCPGYLDELAKLNGTTTNTLATISTTPTTTTTITNDPISPVTTSYSAPTTTSTTTTTATTSTTTPTTSTSTVSSAVPSPTEKTTSGPSLSTILGIVRNEQSRISGVESSAVNQANEAASQASSQAQKTAESVANTAVLNSSVSMASTSSLMGTSLLTNLQQGLLPSTALSTSVVSIGGLRGPQTLNNETFFNSSSSSSLTGISVFNSDIRRSLNISTMEQEPPKQQIIEFTGRSPIKDYLDSKPQVSQDTGKIEQRNTEVKKNVQDNDAAGGVTLTAMAKQPPGFELYMQGIKDAVFYPPKEIYKNQKVIDNQRVLRQLNGKSDRIHEEMVDEQYRSRN